MNKINITEDPWRCQKEQEYRTEYDNMASFAMVGKRYQCSEKSNKIDLRVKIKHNSKLKEQNNIAIPPIKRPVAT